MYQSILNKLLINKKRKYYIEKTLDILIPKQTHFYKQNHIIVKDLHSGKWTIKLY
jgi:hypothetical protein